MVEVLEVKFIYEITCPMLAEIHNGPTTIYRSEEGWKFVAFDGYYLVKNPTIGVHDYYPMACTFVRLTEVSE
jgi:hypothetical protein